MAEEVKKINEDLSHARKASYLGKFKILVEFENREMKVLNCSSMMANNLGKFEELKKEENFKEFYLQKGIITWRNGYEITPEYLYENSK